MVTVYVAHPYIRWSMCLVIIVLLIVQLGTTQIASTIFVENVIKHANSVMTNIHKIVHHAGLILHLNITILKCVSMAVQMVSMLMMLLVNAKCVHYLCIVQHAKLFPLLSNAKLVNIDISYRLIELACLVVILLSILTDGIILVIRVMLHAEIVVVRLNLLV